MIKKELAIRELKAEYVKDYIDAHNNIWPELVSEYKKAGFKNIVCFIENTTLYIFKEYDTDSVYIVDQNIEGKWEELMKNFNDESVEQRSINKVFEL